MEIVDRRIRVLVELPTRRSSTRWNWPRTPPGAPSALVVSPPPYFPINQADLRAYVETLAEGCDLPLFLYNMPSHSKVAFEIGTVRQLLYHPKIAGLKDSSANMLYFNQVLQLAQERSSFHVFIGRRVLAESVWSAAAAASAAARICIRAVRRAV